MMEIDFPVDALSGGTDCLLRADKKAEMTADAFSGIEYRSAALIEPDSLMSPVVA